MTDAPKPPEGYPGWLETIIWCQGSSKENRLARAELDQLRATAAAYREAMKVLSPPKEVNLLTGLARQQAFVESEIASGRWKP